MALNIKSKEADRLARELVATTGESITVAVTKAIGERLDRCRQQRDAAKAAKAANLRATLEEIWKLPVLDDRSPDEILGYNEIGTFD